jgi:hypothetical protein
MSTEENKAVIRRWYDEINKGQEAVMAAIEAFFALK